MRIAAVIALALGAVHAALAADPSDSAATDFFRIADADGRPGIVAPDGTPRFVLGCCWVHPRGSFSHALGHSPYGRFCETNYPSQKAWAEETLGRLRSWGFNNLGAASDVELCGRQGLSHVATLRLGQDFAKGDPDRSILPYGNAPGTALPNVFHPDWPAFCEKRAEELCAAVRDDPWLLGWFLDNELAWGARRGQPATGLCEAVAALPPEHSARKALDRLLADSGGSGAESPSLADKLAFLRLYARTYFETACAAVRRHDPNHLILGCRFAGLENAHPVVWEEAGRFCDVVSVNVYPWADLDRGVVLDEKCGVPVADRFREYGGYAGKPLFVSEWSFPALDTGRKCLVGAGQRVQTQEDRAEAAALFLRAMRDDPHVVGCDWFMWCDRPAAGSSKWNPEDCNYGLVNEEGVPYEGLVSMFKAIHGGTTIQGVSGPAGRSGPAAPSGASRRSDPTDRSGLASSISEPEREQDFAEALGREAAHRPQSGHISGEAALHPVGFRQEADGGWSLSNAFVRLSGRIGSRYMADEIAFLPGGASRPGEPVPVGRYGACLHLLTDGAHVWPDATCVTDVSVSTNADIVSVTIRAEGDNPSLRATDAPVIGGNAAPSLPPAGRPVIGEGGTAAFAVTHRLALAPGSRDVLAEIVSLENLGSEPLFVKQLFLRPYSLEEKPVAVPFAPNVLHGPCEAAWRLPGGGSWGVSSRDEAAARFRFFVDRAGVQHPDARFAPDARAAGFALDPGAVWRPSVPHSATLYLNP